MDTLTHNDGWVNEVRCHICGSSRSVDSSLLLCETHGGRGGVFPFRNFDGTVVDHELERRKAKAHLAERLRKIRERSAAILEGIQ